ncbi:MAG: S-methyl-5-thioribose-1-phosphate isomerase [Verrucomicrobia bacterium]|nr:S-methyl-5-thioribose-1-phosphate isomerase [Verrucomicrobiota bacterium]
MNIDGFAIRYNGGELSILNQQKLPSEAEWIDVQTPEQMVEIISTLKVRGAPMIGVSAVLSLAQMAERGLSFDEIEKAAYLLRKARPTAVNLAICVDRVLDAMRNGGDYRAAILATAENIYREDTDLCASIGEAGNALIQPGERILTYCNTGSLATAGIGTALGVIKAAHAQGKQIHVYACETRPLLQGGRLTAWELEECGIPFTLICDNMAATLMQQGKIDRVLVGADRIAANGDFANKIGTYSVAVLAHFHGVPFHVAAPYTTIDPNCPSGDQIRIEERSPDEVRGYGKICWSPKDAPVYNPAFDVTPSSLVTSYILNVGNLSLEEFLQEAR